MGRCQDVEFQAFREVGDKGAVSFCQDSARFVEDKYPRRPPCEGKAEIPSARGVDHGHLNLPALLLGERLGWR